MKKSDPLDILRNMPEDIELDDLLYRLYLKQELETSEAAIAAGEVLAHDDLVRLSDEWSR